MNEDHDMTEEGTEQLPILPAPAPVPAVSSLAQNAISAVHELRAAVDRADGSLFASLNAAIAGIVALGGSLKAMQGEWASKLGFNALKTRLREFSDLAKHQMPGDASVSNEIRNHIRAITVQVAMTLDAAAFIYQEVEPVSDTQSVGEIKKWLEMLTSFLGAFKIADGAGGGSRLDTVHQQLLKDPYVFRITNNNSNTNYSFGGDIINNNSVKIFIFSDGTDHRTPDLAKQQEKLINAIKTAIGSQFVLEALHETQPEGLGCMPGTREKVLAKFMTWVAEDPKRIFWLAGLAGTGKTAIAVTLCHLLQADSRVLLGGTFFCSRTANRDERVDVRRILPTLATMLAEKSPEFAAALRKELNPTADPRAAYKDVGIQMDCLFKRPLTALSSSVRVIVFLIDALDECSDDSQIEQLLQAISSLASEASVKFIITSRPETHIAVSPATNSNRTSILRLHTIDKAEVTEDIVAYIHGAFSKQPQYPTWFTEGDITSLAARSDGLFIFASTMIKYVLAGRGPDARRKRLHTSLSAAQDSKVAMAPLDAMYSLVLTRASDDRTVEPYELTATLQALACILRARAPLSVGALADLLGQTVDDLCGSLERLQAVVHVPPSHDQLGLQTLHTSFGDYLFERAAQAVRITRFLGDEALAHGCLLVMQKHLRFNVSQSQSSYEPRGTSEHLQRHSLQRRPGTIMPSLEYACLQWIYHIAELPDSSALEKEIWNIFRPRLLFWLEAMSVLRQVWRAVAMLFYATTKVRSMELSQYLRDAHAFVVWSREPIECSAPHVYISALPFEPRDSLVYQTFASQFSGLITVDVVGLFRTRDRLIMTLTGHEDRVTSLTYSPDGFLIASGSDDGTVRIWDTRTGGETTSPLRSGDGRVTSVDFAPTGRNIASGTSTGQVCIWNLCTTQLARLSPLHRPHETQHVAFSPDGSYLASAWFDGTVCLWSVYKDQSPVLLLSEKVTSTVRVVTFSPDSQVLAAGCYDGAIRLWNTATFAPAAKWNDKGGERERHDYAKQPIFGLCFSPNGSVLASFDGDVHFWNLQTGKIVAEVYKDQGTRSSTRFRKGSLKFSPDGEWLVLSDQDDLLVLHAASISAREEAPMVVLRGHKKTVNYSTFSPTGQHIASASDDRTIRIWEVGKHNSTVIQRPGYCKRMASLALKHDGAVIATGWNDGSVRVWSPETGDSMLPPLLGHTGSVNSVAFSPNGLLIASASEDCTIRLWDVEKGLAVGEPFNEHGQSVTAVTFSSDSQRIASGALDGTVRIYDTGTMRPLSFGLLRCHGAIRALSYSPDSRIIAAGADSWYIHLWKADTGEPLCRPLPVPLAGSTSFSFLPHIAQIVSIRFDHLSRAGCWIWDLKTGRLVCSLKGDIMSESQHIFACSPDGQLIATGSRDRMLKSAIRLWNAVTGDLLITLPGYEEHVHSVAFTPDSLFVVAGFRTKARIWDVRAVSAQGMECGSDAIAALASTRFTKDNNWIRGPSDELLLWVPPEYQPHLEGGAITCAIGSRRVVVGRDVNGIHHGKNWTLCWSQSTLPHPV